VKAGIRSLEAFLNRHPRIGLDTSLFIYHLEAHARYAEFADFVFRTITKPRHSAVASTLTMTELLVGPYRKADDQRVNQYYALLTTYPNLEWVAPDLSIADLAAKLRADHNLRTPDAIVAATVAQARATGFITNDPVFKRLGTFETLHLDDLPGGQVGQNT